MEETKFENEQYVAFKLSNELYGVDIRIVKTVEKILPITRVPKTEDHVAGVINLRGEIIPIIDLRKRFGMKVEDYTEESRIIVLNFEVIQIGVIVDCVDEVINMPSTSIQNASNINTQVNSSFVLGVSKVGDKIVTIINFEQLAKDEET